jgi:hypothetical protein
MELILEKILAELQSQDKASLGFCDPPVTRTIYANRQYPDCLWYFWNGGTGKHEPIAQCAIRGVVENVSIEQKEFRGKPDHKLNVLIKADKSYKIQFGLETETAKGILWTLANISDEDLSGPLTIAVEPGETEQVLFTKVYKGSQSLYFERSGEINWKKVANQVVDRFLIRMPESADFVAIKKAIEACQSETDFAGCMTSIEALSLQGTEKSQAITAWQVHKAAMLPHTDVSRINTVIIGAVKELRWDSTRVKEAIYHYFGDEKFTRKDLTLSQLEELANNLLKEIKGAKK